jgi:hypothetical protein
MSLGIEPEGQIITKDKRTLDGYRYIYLTNALTNRLVRELKHAFAQHPRFGAASNVEDNIIDNIQTSFPQKVRAQRGIYITNVSGSLVPLQADNFHGTLVSHVLGAATENHRGAFLSWVKEDQSNISLRAKIDVSSQVSPASSEFTIPEEYLPVIDVRTGEISSGVNPPLSIIRAYVSGSPIRIRQFDGETGEVILANIPAPGSKVELEFWFRNLEPQGLYYLKVLSTEKTQAGQQAQLELRRTHYVDEEVLTEQWDGTTTTFTLANAPIIENSVFGYVNDLYPLVQGTDYTVDLNTGTITIDPTNFLSNDRIFFEYRYEVGTETVDIEFNFPEARNDILKGVVLAFSEDFVVGDEMVIIVNDERVPVAEEYGGRADLSVSMTVYSRDPDEREELLDLVPLLLFVRRKPALDMDGIAVKAPSIGGWGTENYDESSNEPYFTGDISFDMQTDWRFVVPVPVRIKRLDISVESLYDQDTESDDQVHVFRRRGRPTDRNMERVYG